LGSLPGPDPEMTDRLGDDFLRWLSQKLARRAPLSEEEDRERSWLTAQVIASWWKGHPSYEGKAEELEQALVEGWEREPERFAEWGIRPAKYPSSELHRLWGHESVVGSRGRGVPQQRRTDPPRRFGNLDVGPDAAEVFLSHSTLDLEFAMRVGSSLARCGIRPWLAEERIEQGELIFETVRAAMKRSAATIVLLARNSLGSAWVYTEALAGRSALVVCDGDDGVLMELLESWRSMPSPGQDARFDAAVLARLEEDYRARWESGEPAGVQPGIARCAGGRSVDWKQRPDKFGAGARALLRVLRHHSCCVHPIRPARWRGDPHFGDFAAAIRALPKR
jgi:TIR domain